jgi:hypothetical protein
MLFAYLKRILRLDRLRLRGPNGRDEFLLAATAQHLRKLKLIPLLHPYSPHEAARLTPKRVSVRSSIVRAADLGLPNGPRRLDVDDHAVVGVDQIIGGVGEEGVPLVRARPLGRRIGSRDELRRHRRRRQKSRVVQSRNLFACGANRALLDLLRLPVLAWNRALLVRVRSDEAGVDRKSISADQTLCHAVLNDALEQMTQQIALAKAAMGTCHQLRL